MQRRRFRCLAAAIAAAVLLPLVLPLALFLSPPARAEGSNRLSDSQVVAEVRRRSEALDRRAHDLDLREAQIAAAEQLARREIAELTSLRIAVEKAIAQQTQAAEADVTLLVNLYSNMKPVQAAGIFSKLDAPKAAAILRRLEPRLAGPIVAAMDPPAAAAVTDELQKAHAAFLP